MLKRVLWFRSASRSGVIPSFAAVVAMVATVLCAANANAMSIGNAASAAPSRDFSDAGVHASTLGFLEFGSRSDSPAASEHVGLGRSHRSSHAQLIQAAIGMSSENHHRSGHFWESVRHDRGSWRGNDRFHRLLLALLEGGSRFAEWFQNYHDSNLEIVETQSGGGDGAGVVPEPGTATMLGLGMISLGLFSQRGRKQS